MEQNSWHSTNYLQNWNAPFDPGRACIQEEQVNKTKIKTFRS
jgi:hypothetical protein